MVLIYLFTFKQINNYYDLGTKEQGSIRLPFRDNPEPAV